MFNPLVQATSGETGEGRARRAGATTGEARVTGAGYPGYTGRATTGYRVSAGLGRVSGKTLALTRPDPTRRTRGGLPRTVGPGGLVRVSGGGYWVRARPSRV